MTDKDLAKKIRIRAGHRAHVTKLLAQSEDLIEQERPDLTEIERFIDTFTEKLDLLRKLDDDIISLVKDEDIEPQILEGEELRDKIRYVKIKLIEKKGEQRSVERNPPSKSPSPAPVVSNSTYLPKLQLAKYNGDPKKWQEWYDSYESAIHENEAIPPAHKLRHLKTLLEGPAAAAISGLTLTAANYSEAISVLKSRFAQKEAIIDAHMEALLNIPAISSEKDVKGLRRIFDNIETNIRSLKALGIDSSQYGALLIPVVKRKIPEEIRLSLSKTLKKEDWTLDRILELFGDEIEARERCSQTSISGAKSSHVQHRNYSAPTASALVATGGAVTCTFCRKAHPSVNCTIVSNCAARKEILKREGRCFVCLKKSHLARQCTSNIRCFKCKKRHHASVCEQPPESIQTAEERNPSTSSTQSWMQSQTQTNPVRRDIGPSTSTPTTTMLIDVKNAVLLQTAKGYISAASSPDKTVVSRMIFDSGSQKTYISDRLRGALGLPTISREALSIKVFGTDEGTPKLYDVTQFCIRSPYSDENLYVTAHVINKVCAPLKNQVIQQAVKHTPPLASLPLADWPENEAQDLEVDILIGSDFYWHFMTGRCIRGEYGPAALETKIGWVLSGPVPWDQEAQYTQTNLTLTHLLMVNEEQSKEDELTKESLENQLSKFWDLENLGISKSEDTVYQNFEEEIKFVNGRYEVKLPWKEQHPLLPDNFKLSQKRLHSLGKRLKCDPEILQTYDEVIQDQLEKGIIERVSLNEESPVGKTCYIPHQAVIKKDRDTTKLRVVYDASAKRGDEPSLNNCLYPGPCLLHNVAEILARFRFHSTALVADIEKAFLMIAIHPDDRNALRFLWYENIEEENPDVIIYRFCRVIFGVNCSPFLLNATLNHHVNQYMESHEEICKEILRSLYVDDLNTGAQSDEECMQIYNVARKIMLDGAFNLRKWRTNSKSLQKEIDAKESVISSQSHSQEIDQEVEESYAKSTVGNKPESNSQEQKVLGLIWDYEEDDLIFRLSKIAEEGLWQPPTKRAVLRTIAKVFDPLGLITPVTTPMKVLFQDVCKSKTDWDETLQPELQGTWEKWLKSCEKAGEIKIPRHYFGEKKEKAKEIELHGFCDSSQTSYAAAVYAKYESEGTTKVSLVMSKTRVAPISKLSIPRLELMSCLILSRLMESVKEALQPIVKIKDTHYWSDSVTALYWIKGTDKDWSIFFDNRVQEIRRLSSPKQWKHCPGKENPADLPTRGTTPLKLSEKSN